ncbi:MAG: hypothetical protein IKH84_02615 [Ottowia sp.]|nr:hypothetical protein [Ottowia sp.]
MTFEPDTPPIPAALNRGTSPLYWVISGVAAVLLVVGAWRAWQWFEGDVQRRRSVAETVLPTGVELHARADREAAAQMQELAQALPAPVEVGDLPDAVAPVPQLDMGALSGSDRTEACRFVAAEIERLSYEFGQELPPPVLDHLSTRLGLMRDQYQAGKCSGVAPLRAGVSAKRQAASSTAQDDK